jgi:hypothetical protein
MRRFIDKFSEKDIQILKIYNYGRKCDEIKERT